LASIRSALLTYAALSITFVVPAQAGPVANSIVSAANASLPELDINNLLDPQGEPQLSPPATDQAQPDEFPPVTEPEAAPDATETTTEEAPARPTGDLSEMVAELRGPDAGSRELQCLATGIYFESKGEPLAGQLAVGQVIANRAQSGGRFPSTYCGVLFQRGQFSFVRGGRLPAVPTANRQWQTAVAIAKIVDQDLKESSVGNALFFHARYVSPGWRLKRVAAIGNHVFYR
jgi:spore germination cell wall hydrolase CwlJ-like protein